MGILGFGDRWGVCWGGGCPDGVDPAQPSTTRPEGYGRPDVYIFERDDRNGQYGQGDFPKGNRVDRGK